MSVSERNGKLVASFPVEDGDQIMLVTDKGQLIRCPVEDIRIAGRSTQGVIVFDTADEHVVSVEHIGEDTDNGNTENGNGGWGAPTQPLRPRASAPLVPDHEATRLALSSWLHSP